MPGGLPVPGVPRAPAQSSTHDTLPSQPLVGPLVSLLVSPPYSPPAQSYPPPFTVHTPLHCKFAWRCPTAPDAIFATRPFVRVTRLWMGVRSIEVCTVPLAVCVW